MAMVEVLYPCYGAKRGDRITVPDDKVGALRRLHWAREIQASASDVAPTPRARRVKVQKKGSGIDANISTETE